VAIEILVGSDGAIPGLICFDANASVWEHGFAHIRYEGRLTVISFSPNLVPPTILLAAFTELLTILPQRAVIIRTQPNIYSLHFGIVAAFSFAWKLFSEHQLRSSQAEASGLGAGRAGRPRRRSRKSAN
jgi:hypothetical protein